LFAKREIHRSIEQLVTVMKQPRLGSKTRHLRTGCLFQVLMHSVVLLFTLVAPITAQGKMKYTPAPSTGPSMMPTRTPTRTPTTTPSVSPTPIPSGTPSTSVPSMTPKITPSVSFDPTQFPSGIPSISLTPSANPVVSNLPSTSAAPSGITSEPPSARPQPPSDPPTFQPNNFRVAYLIQIKNGKVDYLEGEKFATGLQTAVTTVANEVASELLKEIEQNHVLRRRLIVADVSMPSFLNIPCRPVKVPERDLCQVARHDILITSTDFNVTVYRASLVGAVREGRLREVYKRQTGSHDRIEVLTGKDIPSGDDDSCDQTCRTAIGLGVGLGLPTLTVASCTAEGSGAAGIVEFLGMFSAEWIISLLAFPTTVILFYYLLRCNAVYKIKNKSGSIATLILHTDQVQEEMVLEVTAERKEEEDSGNMTADIDVYGQVLKKLKEVFSLALSCVFSYKMTVIPGKAYEYTKLKEGEERKFVFKSTLYLTLARYTKSYEPCETTDGQFSHKIGEPGHIVYFENRTITKGFHFDDDDLNREPLRFIVPANWDDYVNKSVCVTVLNPIQAEDDETQVTDCTPERPLRGLPHSDSIYVAEL